MALLDTITMGSTTSININNWGNFENILMVNVCLCWGYFCKS